MSGSFSFLPNLRSAVVAAATPGPDGRLQTTYQIEIKGDGVVQGARIAQSARFRGPGEVVGLDPGQILRVEPARGMRGFAHNFFPFVEFRDADFPWRYATEAGVPDRLAPWLALVALRPEEFSPIAQGSAPLPAVQVADGSTALPDLAEAWAWAHVHVDRPDPNETALAAVTADPGRGFARLLCLRRLAPAARYTLFLVPTREAGRLAGLGFDPGATDPRQPAWTGGAQGVTLPYYFSAEFVTAGPGDLEAALRRLGPYDPPPVAQGPGDGTTEKPAPGVPQQVLSHRPGYYDGFQPAQSAFDRQAALMRQDYIAPAATEIALARRMAETLNTVIAGEAPDAADDEDPLVAFPPYGARYTPVQRVDVAAMQSGAWCDRINLDLKFRDAAALGARVVHDNQEAFAKACWDQYGEVVAANRAIARLALATALARRVVDRHFARLDSDIALALAEPFQRYATAAQGARGRVTVGGVLEAAGTPETFASRDMRRAAARKPARDAETGLRVVAQPMIPGDLTPGVRSRPRPDSAVRAIEAELAARQTAPARAEGAALLARVSGPGKTVSRVPLPLGIAIPVAPVRSAALANNLGDRLSLLPRLKSDALVRGLSAAERAAERPVWRAPRIDDPLAPRLMRLGRAALLPGQSDLPEDTVSLFVENRAFIEAFLVGANHAMNDELRWREFPTDLRGTVFRRFWNRGAAPGLSSGDDIGDIHLWRGRLGRQVNPANPDGKPNIVVVIRGEAIRIMDQPIALINIAAGQSWVQGAGRDHAPEFFGKLAPDIAYYGFDLGLDWLRRADVLPRAFFLLSELPGRLRFGLDTERTQPMRSWDDLSWDRVALHPSDYVGCAPAFRMPKPAGERQNLWADNRTSATIARSFWQKPVAAVLPLERVIHAD